MNTIKDYLKELKAALKGSDAATIQDALADAEEYLVEAVQAISEDENGVSAEGALSRAISQYGTPAEVAAAYRDAEQILSPILSRRKTMKQKSITARFFGVFADPMTWGSLLFVLLSMVTGIVFFTWTVTGFSLSASFLIFIFGLFFLLFFLYSLRGIALVEGKLVEALLGTRMPHRPLFAPKNLPWKEQLKLLVKDKHTWLTLLYMLVKLPLGVIFFSVLIVLLCCSLTLLLLPLVWFVILFGIPDFYQYILAIQGQLGVWASHWMIVVYGLVGILALTGSMYVAKGSGILQAKWAKLMLVVD
jgi:uncharacterized membrane protein